jgi:hypothetical protein
LTCRVYKKTVDTVLLTYEIPYKEIAIASGQIPARIMNENDIGNSRK